MNDKNNLFGAIRYWAAYAVLMLHYTCFWRIYREPMNEIEAIFDRVTVFTPVVIFIAVSGYLTAASLDRTPDLKTFFRKRFKRIYIPLWISMVVYLITYLVIAKDHIDHTIIRWFILGMAGIAYTPPCLKEFASGSANGVLWTVTVLIELYFITGLYWKQIKRITSKASVSILLVILIMCNIASCFVQDHSQSGAVLKILERTFIPYAVFFYIGIVGYVYRDRLKGWLQFIGMVAAVLVLAMTRYYLPDYGYYTGIIRGVLTAVAAVGIGSWSPASVGDQGAAALWGLFSRYDITYEIYLYQWIIFNVIIYLGLYDSADWNIIKRIVVIAVFMAATLMHLLGRSIYAVCDHATELRSRGKA